MRYKERKKSMLLPHDSGTQVIPAVWTAFSITLRVSGKNDVDAITKLALKGMVMLPETIT